MIVNKFKKQYPQLTYVLGAYVSVEAQFNIFDVDTILAKLIDEEDSEVVVEVLKGAARDIQLLLHKRTLPVAELEQISNIVPNNNDWFDYLIHMYHLIEDYLDAVI